MRAALNNPRNYVTPAQIRATDAFFRDWLKIRASSTLFRMDNADDIKKRLTFPATYVQTDPQLIVAVYDGEGLAGARFKQAMVIINAATTSRTIALQGNGWKLHPVLAGKNRADKRLAQVRIGKGIVKVPAYMPLVLVRN